MELDPKELAAETKSIAQEAATKAVETKSAETDAKLETKADANAVAEVKSAVTENTSKLELLQKSVDDVKLEAKNITEATKVVETKSFDVELKNLITERKEDILAGTKVEMDFKTLNYGSGGTLANVPMEDRVMDIKTDPHYKNRVRNHVMTGTTDGDIVRYNEQAAGFANPIAGKAHGAAFADFSPTLQNKEEKVITLGAFTTINEEQLDDVAGLNSFFRNQLMGYALDVENTQILFGAGTGNNWAGLATDGTAWVDQRAAGGAAIANANLFDVLTNGVAQMAKENYVPKKIFLNPVDFYGKDFALAKSTQGEYVLRQVQNGITPVLYGAEIIVTPAVTADKFIILDTVAAEYHMREGMTVEFYRNADDFQNNNISIRVKYRGCVTNYRPLGIVQGDVTDAIAELAAAQS